MARGKSTKKLLLDASQAALFAGIEIHNKPNIAYRYPTATILIINAWELRNTKGWRQHHELRLF